MSCHGIRDRILSTGEELNSTKATVVQSQQNRTFNILFGFCISLVKYSFCYDFDSFGVMGEFPSVEFLTRAELRSILGKEKNWSWCSSVTTYAKGFQTILIGLYESRPWRTMMMAMVTVLETATQCIFDRTSADPK